MAEAGSVAPVFRDGGYDATTTYDFYHAIIYNNKLYFCRKDGTIGHEPQEESDEYWFLSIDGNIVDASTLNGKTESELSVANSEKLGGKGASEYATDEWTRSIDKGITSESALVEYLNSISTNMPIHTEYTRTIQTNFNGATIPKAGIYLVKGYKFTANEEFQILTSYGYSSDNMHTVIRHKYVGTWSTSTSFATTANLAAALANYLPLIGGTVTGTGLDPLSLNTSSDDARILMRFLNKSVVQGHLGFNGVNNPVFFDTSGKSNPIIHSGNVGEHAFPITGGYLKGSVRLQPYANGRSEFFKNHNATTDNGTNLVDVSVDNLKAQIVLSAKNNSFIFVGSDNVARNVHHDGNSVKVVKATSAPSDITAVWVDTANKATKIYIDGAWTALA